MKIGANRVDIYRAFGTISLRIRRQTQFYPQIETSTQRKGLIGKGEELPCMRDSARANPSGLAILGMSSRGLGQARRKTGLC
jgi:hypothetical protein